MKKKKTKHTCKECRHWLTIGCVVRRHEGLHPAANDWCIEFEEKPKGGEKNGLA